MSLAMARSLLLADAMTPQALAQALWVAATRGTSLVHALLATGAVDVHRLERLLDVGDVPQLRHVAPLVELVVRLPPGLCERLLVVPVRRDARTGTVDVAVVDARDPHPVGEVAYWLRSPVRMVRTSIAVMTTALHRLAEEPPPPGPRALAAPIWVPPAREAPRDLSRTPAYGSPIVGGAVEFGRPYAALRERTTIAGAAVDHAAPLPAPAVPPIDPAAELARGTPAPSAESAEGPKSQGSEMPPPSSRKSALSRQTLDSALDPMGALLDNIRSAGDRDAVLEEVVTAAKAFTRKVAVLAVRRGTLIGWTCSSEFGSRAALRAARVVLSMTEVLGAALASPAPVQVMLPKDGTHAPLLAPMHQAASGKATLMTIVVEDKPVALMLAYELGDSPLALQGLADIAHAAGEALARMLREKRREPPAGG